MDEFRKDIYKVNNINVWENLFTLIKKYGTGNFYDFASNVNIPISDDMILRQLVKGDKNLSAWEFNLLDFINRNKDFITFFDNAKIIMKSGKQSPNRKSDIGILSLAKSLLENNNLELLISNIHSLKKINIYEIAYNPLCIMQTNFKICKENRYDQYLNLRKIYSDGNIEKTTFVGKTTSTFEVSVFDCKYIIDIRRDDGIYGSKYRRAIINNFYFDSNTLPDINDINSLEIPNYNRKSKKY